MWDNPSAFNETLETFLREVDNGGVATAGGGDVQPAFHWGISDWSEGIASRQAGPRRDLVLVHGLGMSSAYFRPFAEALYAQGWNPIAPDLPGFGESADGGIEGPEGHAEILAAWARRSGITSAVWIGHSLGANAVAHLAAAHPGLVRAAIGLGPLWTHSRPAVRRLFFDLVRDAIREPLALHRYVTAAYLRAGVSRWWRTFARYEPDVKVVLPAALHFHCLAGAGDPLVDRPTVESIDPGARLELPGAHACHFSHPLETALAVGAVVRVI